MSAPTFNYGAPTFVERLEPVYALEVTESENFKKHYQLLDTDKIEQYRVVYLATTSTIRGNIRTHFTHADVAGGYGSWTWDADAGSCPSYISGSDLTVRFVPGTYRETPRLDTQDRYDVEFVVEKAI